MGKCVVPVSWGRKGGAKEIELILMAEQTLVGQDLLLLKLHDHRHTTLGRIPSGRVISTTQRPAPTDAQSLELTEFICIMGVTSKS